MRKVGRPGGENTKKTLHPQYRVASKAVRLLGSHVPLFELVRGYNYYSQRGIKAMSSTTSWAGL